MNTEKLAKAYETYKKAFKDKHLGLSSYEEAHDTLIKEIKAILIKNTNK